MDGWMETRQDDCDGVGIVRLGETSIVRQPEPLEQTYSPWEPGLKRVSESKCISRRGSVG